MNGLYQRRRKRPEMNLVPLVDVLVMLVFFSFVTMQFRSAGALNITLPAVETAGHNAFKGSVVLEITAEGVFSFNGKPATGPQLEQLLLQVRQADRDTPVLIRADENTPLKSVTFVMDACRKAGLNKFNLQSR